MSMDKLAYPANWADLSRYIRFERAGGQCECHGECGLHQTHPGPRRCVEKHGGGAIWAGGTVILTTAHLCHDSTCEDREHLRAMCQRCHLRYDQEFHVVNARETREKKSGQLRLI